MACLRCESLRIADLDIGRNSAYAAICVTHFGIDMPHGTAVVQRLHEASETAGNYIAADFSHTGELTVIRLQAFLQQQEAVNLRMRELWVLRQCGVRRGDDVANQAVDRIEGG